MNTSNVHLFLIPEIGDHFLEKFEYHSGFNLFRLEKKMAQLSFVDYSNEQNDNKMFISTMKILNILQISKLHG